MRFHPLCSIIQLYWIFAFACASVVANPGIFYNPPTGGPIHEYQNDPVYTVGEIVQLRWATTLKSLSIVLWQNNNPDYEWVQTGLQGVTSYDWRVSTNRNLSHGEVFFFQIRNASNLNDLNELFASHYFNITKDSSSTRTVSSLTTSTTQATPSTQSLNSSATLIQAVATTTTTSGTTQGTSGLSNGARIGVGVGVGLGGSLIVALALFFFLRRRSKKPTQINETNSVTSQTQAPMDSKPYNGQPQNSAEKIFEAPANEARVFEL